MTWVCGLPLIIICSEVAQMIPGKFPSLGFDIGNFLCNNCKKPIPSCRNRNAIYCSSECKNEKNAKRRKIRTNRSGYHNVGRTRADGKNPYD